MSSIGGGGGRVPPKPTDQQPTAEPLKPGVGGTPGTKPESAQKPDDRFERAPAPQAGSQLPAQFAELKGPAGKVQFTQQDYAYLAQQFAGILKQHPNASRTRRAQLFTKAILKRRRMRKLLAGMSEAQMEEMAESIGDVLSDSPVFGELIDKVTKGAQKLSAED